MNKLHITSLALCLIVGTASAQPREYRHPLSLKQQLTKAPACHITVPPAADRDVIWADDLSDPSNWTFGNLDGTSGSWVIGITPPGGPFAINPIASTTAANGFALYDSDLLGPNSNAWMATANPIDLSAYPGVVIKFQQYFAMLNGHFYLETSTDDTTWNTVQINTDVPYGSTAHTNPDIRSINLSGQIGGAATVWVRFRYESSTADYAWMIDDISIATLPANELVMDHGNLSQFGNGFEYGQVPYNLLPTSMEVGARVINSGISVQTNVSVSVSLRDENDMEVASATSEATASMVSGDTVDIGMPLTPTTPLYIGTYKAHFTMSSDQIGMDEDVSNNTTIRYFEVTSDLYSLDALDVVPDSLLVLASAGTGSFGNNTEDVRLMNYFEVPVQQTFIGVEVVLGPNTQAGTYFSAAVYDTAEIQVGQYPMALAVSDFRVITQFDLDNGRRAGIDFMSPLILGPGAYYISANLYQEQGSDISIVDDLTVSQPAVASLIYLPNDDEYRFVYSNGNAWAVRLKELIWWDFVGERSGLDGIIIYPSPSSGMLHVQAKYSGNKSVEVINALGAKVQTANFTGTGTSLDLSGHAAGIYTVRVGDGSNFNIQRIVLK